MRTLSTPSMSRRWATAAVFGATVWLAGCASTYRVDSRVESFARWTGSGSASAGLLQAPQTYRFERLPSQREGEASARQDTLESLARQALSPLGWTAEDGLASAPWTVQVAASASRSARSPWDDPWPHVWPVFGLGIGSRGARVSGQLVWGPAFPYHDLPYTQRQVSLVVREAASGRVVYETRATHDGRWNDVPELWQAMIGAALRDFPAPPTGPREVNVDLPR